MKFINKKLVRIGLWRHGTSRGAVLRLNRRTAVTGLRRESDSKLAHGMTVPWAFFFHPMLLPLPLSRALVRAHANKLPNFQEMLFKTPNRPVARFFFRGVPEVWVFYKNRVARRLGVLKRIAMHDRDALERIFLNSGRQSPVQQRGGNLTPVAGRHAYGADQALSRGMFEYAYLDTDRGHDKATFHPDVNQPCLVAFTEWHGLEMVAH